MMKITRNATVNWKGGANSGQGAITTQSGALSQYPYGFNSRFGDKKGTNPEELIAAAHASCFTMLLSFLLEQEHLTADQIDTKAVVTLEEKDGGFDITSSQITLTAKIPGISQEKFDELVAKAKVGCPVSKILKTNISVESQLLG